MKIQKGVDGLLIEVTDLDENTSSRFEQTASKIEEEVTRASNAEGELSVLKNNLYKMMLLLQSQNDTLRKDKTYLAASLADISHQLKTPLTSITMSIALTGS